MQQPLSLCLAVQSEDVQRVSQVLEENESQCENLVDQRDEHSHAPLHIACAIGNMYVYNMTAHFCLKISKIGKTMLCMCGNAQMRNGTCD